MGVYIEREKALNTVFRSLSVEAAHKFLAAIPPADVVPGRDFRDCRNELCLRCGEYKQRHLGACDGCRWLEVS